jgi:cell filamentation protein
MHREGNGRAQLSFFLPLADNAGHSVGLDEFDPAAFLAAMIASFEGDEGPIAAIVERLVDSK